MPRASIVVPAYNVAATLPETLASLLAQSERDLEVIVVDDGSTDETANVAEAHMRDPRVRLVRQRNRGLAGARNSGVAAARGAAIGFCDSDDLWEPDKLAAHLRHLEANPHVGLSYSGSLLIDECGAPTGCAQRPRLTGIDAAHILKRNPVGNGSAPVFRAEALREIAYRPDGETARDWVFDETFRQSEDIECWLRFALTTRWAIEGAPGLLTRYRVNACGLSADTDRQLAAWERMVEKLTPLAPGFFARHAPAARAYQLRYLARRAVSDNRPAKAARLLARSFTASPRPLFEEPAKTAVTLAATLVLALFGAGALRAATGLATLRSA